MKAIVRGMHREEIKAAIRMKGETLRSLSRRWGYEQAAVSVTLSRPAFPKIEVKLATFLGTTPEAIWPDRYFPNGQRRPLLRRSNGEHSTNAANDNVQIGEAA